MATTTKEPVARLPRRRVFEANFPMDDHVCDGREYCLERKEKTGREVAGKTVFRYVFVPADENKTRSE